MRCGVDVDLMLFADDSTERTTSVDGVRVTWVPPPGRRSGAVRMLGSALRFRTAYRAHDYDAVFLPEWGGIGALLPGGAPLATNLATGIRLGDWIAGRRNRDFALRLRLGRWLHDRLETRQIRRSRGLVSISAAVLRWNQHFVTRLPFAAIVRNCVDVALIRQQAAGERLPDDWPAPDGMASPTILFVGRRERRKGVLVAMAAFATLLGRYPTARLVLAGSSGDRRFEPTIAELLDAVPREHRAQVTFLGHVPGPRLFAAVRAADVAMCPSLWEGFGNVALEVKAVGTPLVVTTGSGFDDFCTSEEDCLMVPPDDAEALAGALARLLESATLRERLVYGATASLQRFTADAVAIDLVRAVEALLGTERGRGDHATD
ncbi:MAG: hypothetical protein JWQ19_670 [Subtercola sp.]|nr:hypothetical protein [Subtercola sp.]